MLKKAVQRTVSVRLTETDFQKLEQQAGQAGLKPGVFARLLLRTELNAPSRIPRIDRAAEVRRILAEMDRLRSESPATDFDPVELIRRGREERTQQMMDVLLDRNQE